MQIADKDFVTANATETPSDTAPTVEAAGASPTTGHDGTLAHDAPQDGGAAFARGAAEPKSGAKTKTNAKYKAKKKTKDETTNKSGPKASSSRQSSKDNSAKKQKGASDDLKARLLARFQAPTATLDRRLVPVDLLSALDAAGLGGREHLPTAALLSLSMLAAVAGPALSFAAYPPALRGTLGQAVGIGMRIVLVAPDRDLPFVPPAIITAAYAVENRLIDLHREEVADAAAQQRVANQRRELQAQATEAAAALQIAPPPPLTETAVSGPGAVPRIVVDEGAAGAVVKAAGGGSGIWLVDGRRMPTMARVGQGDPETAGLLNAVALGHPIAATDPDSGRTIVRVTPVAVAGLLTNAECACLYNVEPAALSGTAFLPAAVPPPGGDSGPLAALAERVHALTAAPIALRMSPGALSALTDAAEVWHKAAADALPPLSDFLRRLPDMVRRLAVAIHMAAAAGGDGKLAVEISAVTAKRALSIVAALIAPAARSLLAPVSAGSQVEIDARRMIGFLRQHTSEESPQIERRSWHRGWQSSMPTPRFNAGANLLHGLKLLAPTEPPLNERGTWWAAAPAVHAL